MPNRTKHPFSPFNVKITLEWHNQKRIKGGCDRDRINNVVNVSARIGAATRDAPGAKFFDKKGRLFSFVNVVYSSRVIDL